MQYVAVVCLVLMSVGVSMSQTPLVTINTGTLQGQVCPRSGLSNIWQFLGVPFAQPPVRWQQAVPAANWTGIYNATYPRSSCLQLCFQPGNLCPPANMLSEDCLTLQVYVPSSVVTSGFKNASVLFFIPGGRYYQGSSSGWCYDGSVLANVANAVVVVTNYRLGVFGFMAGGDPALPGSYGITDQQLALQWVQQNIRAFGGDPARVTIFGESAGGTSVAIHLTLPSSYGLYSAAIIHSDPWANYMKPLSDALTTTVAVATNLSCNVEGNLQATVTCLRTKSANAVLAAGAYAQSLKQPTEIEAGFPWSPASGTGALLPGQPISQIIAGSFNRVPLMLGTVEAEGRLFIWEGDPNPLSATDYDLYVAGLFRSCASAVLKLYPSISGDNRPQFSIVMTDYNFICPVRRAAQVFTNAGLPVFSYHFDHSPSFPYWGPGFTECDGYACHTIELPYLFQSVTNNGWQFTSDEQTLATSMTNAWANFASTTNPNQVNQGRGGPINPPWPQYNPSVDNIFNFSTPNGISPAYRKQFCDMFDVIGYVPNNIPPGLPSQCPYQLPTPASGFPNAEPAFHHLLLSLFVAVLCVAGARF